MIRQALVRIAATVAALSLVTGCSGGSGGKEEITVVLFGDVHEVAGYRTLVDGFMAQNEDVEVTLSPVATQDELMARLTTAFAGGQPPDVFLLNFRRYGQFAAEGVIDPVQPYVDASEVIDESDYSTASMDAFRFDGEELTCFPQNLSSLVVYFNQDLFDEAGLSPPEAGWTWEDFLATAQALTAGDTYGLGVEPSLIRVAPFIWSNGGDLVDDPEEPSALTLTTDPAAREAVDWFLDLQAEHGVVPPDVEEQSESSEARFLRGTLGMYLNSRVAVPTLRTIESFEWDVAPLPVAPGGQPASILHTDAYCMSAGGDADTAWRFVEYAVGPAGQEVLARSGRTVPSLLEVARSDVFLEPAEPPASSHVWLDAEPHLRATPRTGSWSRVEREGNALFEEIFYERVDREEGLRRLESAVLPLFQLGPGLRTEGAAQDPGGSGS